MASVFQPGYILLKRTPFTKMMKRKYVVEMHRINSRNAAESRCTSKICPATDVRTSIAMETYSGLTCQFINDEGELVNFNLTTVPLEERHTAVNITSWIEAVVAKFEIPSNKLLAIVHDNAANMVCALKLLEDRHRIVFK